jgi:serine/threonine-protein kinase
VTRGVHRDDRHVAAVKEAFDHPRFITRLEREIKVQRQISHPNVMPVIHASPEHLWYSMPLADTDLHAFRESSDWDPGHLGTILLETWRGLTAAHAIGHVHRDVTPRNILRVGERCVVSDFGLVTKGDRESLASLTRAGAELGTTGFIAPEVLRDPRAASPASDLFSLGVIASWAMTGTWPKEGSLLVLPKDPDWADFVRRAVATQPLERLSAAGWLLERERAEAAEAWHRERNACFFCGSLQGFFGPSLQCFSCKVPNVAGY